MNPIFEPLYEMKLDLKYDDGMLDSRTRAAPEMFILVDLKTQEPIRSVNSDVKEWLEQHGIKFNESRNLFSISRWDAKQRWGYEGL